MPGHSRDSEGWVCEVGHSGSQRWGAWALQGFSGAGPDLELSTPGILRGFFGVGCRETRQRPGEEQWLSS